MRLAELSHPARHFHKTVTSRGGNKASLAEGNPVIEQCTTVEPHSYGIKSQRGLGGTCMSVGVQDSRLARTWKSKSWATYWLTS